MDPQAALDRAADALAAGNLDEAAEALADYRRWRRRGGFMPPDGDARAAMVQRQLRGAKGSTGADSEIEPA